MQEKFEAKIMLKIITEKMNEIKEDIFGNFPHWTHFKEKKEASNEIHYKNSWNGHATKNEELHVW